MAGGAAAAAAPMMGGKAGKLANAAKKGDQLKGLKSDVSRPTRTHAITSTT